MNDQELRNVLTTWFEQLRSIGKHAPSLELGEVFDAHFPFLVIAGNTATGVQMSAAAKERGLAAFMDAAVTKERRVDDSVGRKWSWRKVAWPLAAAAVGMLAMLGVLWLLQYRNDGDRIALPTPQPEKTTPNKPQPKGPDLDRPDDQIVKEQSPTPGPTVPHSRAPRQNLLKPPSVVASTADEIGKIGKLEGEPKVLAKGSSSPVALERDTRITAGSTIETGDAGYAELLMADGSTLRLSFNTEVVPINDREFELRKGTLFADVAKTANERKFTIYTAAASARALGTSFGLTVEKLGTVDTRAVLQVREGTVKFFNEFGNETVTDMSMSSAAVGKAPTEPRRLNSLTLYGFTGSGQMLERRTFPLDEEAAATYYVYPLGSAGFVAGTVPGGHLNIITLSQNASARRAGLSVGDTILTLNGQRPTMNSIRRDIYHLAGNDVVLRIRRDGAPFDVTVPVDFEDPWVSLPDGVEVELIQATRPAIEGDTEVSRQRLEVLSQQVRHPAVFNNLGVVYERLDQMGPAIRNYQEAVRGDKRNDLFRRNLGRVLLHIGNFKRALEELETAHSLDPKDSRNTLALNDVYQIVGRRKDALALIESSLQGAPESVDLWIAKSSSLMGLDRLDESVEAAEKATMIAPDSASAHFRLGLGLTFSNRFEEAEKAFSKAIELDPCLATYYNSRAINLMNLGRNSDAETEYRKAITLDPDFVPARIGLGNMLIGSDRLAEAEVLLRRTTELDPQSPDAHYNLAVALRWQGKLEDAEEMLRTTIAIGVLHVDFYWEHAIVLGLLGRYEDSIVAYERAVSLFPKNTGVLGSFAWFQIEMRNWADAVKNLRRALELDSTSDAGFGSRINLGYALVNLGQLEEAELVIKETMRLRPDDNEASSNYGLLLAHRGSNLDEALARAKSAATPDGHAQWLHTLGFVHFRRAEYDEAISVLTKAVEAYGKVYLAADALFILGQAHEAKRDISAAINAYQRAVAIDRRHHQSADALGRLRR